MDSPEAGTQQAPPAPKPPSKRPRRGVSKLDRELIKRFCYYIKRGAFRGRAAALVGVHEVTVSNWMARGAAASAKDPGERLYREFFQKVMRAEARCQQNALDTIRAAASANPKHLQWFLTRRFPGEWGRRDNVAEENPSDQAADAKALREQLVERFLKLAKTAVSEQAKPESPDA